MSKKIPLWLRLLPGLLALLEHPDTPAGTKAMVKEQLFRMAQDADCWAIVRDEVTESDTVYLATIASPDRNHVQALRDDYLDLVGMTFGGAS